MFGQLFSADIQIAFILIIAFILVLYILSIIWVFRDAHARGAKWKMWGLIALIPIAGVVAYVLLRPQLLLIDRDEQELEIAIKQRELMKYGECSKCGHPVMNDYLVCPNCRQRLKVACVQCGKPLNFKWKACPWCGTPKFNIGEVSVKHADDKNINSNNKNYNKENKSETFKYDDSTSKTGTDQQDKIN